MLPPAVLEEPTPEMRRWARVLAPLLRPGSILGAALVTPIAHMAHTSFSFQVYLYALFHRSRLSRVGHWVCMPAILLVALALLGTLWMPLLVGGGVALTAWYVLLGRSQGLWWLGGVSAALAVGLSAGAAWVVVAAAPSAWVLLALLGALGWLQTLSHAAEPDVPPRVSGTGQWQPLGPWLRHAPLRHGVRAIAMSGAGLINELWASWRLLPVIVLHALWSVGYAPALLDAHRAVVREALRHGNPAIDFVGDGGACTGVYP
jgi:hypothetical protein